MKKRKDSNGRVLKEGESQRKNGSYVYKFKDVHGVTRYVYAPTLDQLREKKSRIEKDLILEIDSYSDRTLGDQIRRTLGLRVGLKDSTKKTYSEWFRQIENDPIMGMRITGIKSSHLKQWISQKEEAGLSGTTIFAYFTGLLRPAFSQAIEDDLINRNPATFKINGIITEANQGRALTRKETELFVNFLDDDRRICKSNKPLLIFILETGLRASEVAAVTLRDIDFVTHTLIVDKQLVGKGTDTHISSTKTKSGNRRIPLSHTAEECIREACKKSHAPETIDGYSGFIFTGRSGTHLDRDTINRRYTAIRDLMIEEGVCTSIKDTSIHSLRHTFCTVLFRKGMDIKSIQYLMGHKKVNTLLDIYTHVQQEEIHEQFLQLKNAN